MVLQGSYAHSSAGLLGPPPRITHAPTGATGRNTTTFTWDVNRGIPQVLDDESLRYVYGIGRIAQVGASTHYYLSDGLGSTMALTDADGDVVNDYDYDVFGGLRDSSGSQANDFPFAGEQVDGGTGLQYLRARYYDNEVGRFISRDPMAQSPFWQDHIFAYVQNSVTNAVDPTGLGEDGDDGAVDGTYAEKLNQCTGAWEECQRIAVSLGLKYGKFMRVCNDVLTTCAERAARGGELDIDELLGEARKRLAHLFVEQPGIVDDIIRKITPPLTGSGGLWDTSESKEGSFTICGAVLW